MNWPGRLPEIEADLEALRKVFYHLIVNAIKYTPDGGASHGFGQGTGNQSKRVADGAIKVIVSDTGMGIDPRFHG